MSYVCRVQQGSRRPRKLVRRWLDIREAQPLTRHGRRLLPTIDGRSVWGRILRDSYQAMLAHCGGADYVSEPKRMASRRSAVLETELCFLEDKMARLRGEGAEPDPALLDLYGRLAGQQKRQNEVVGYERTQRDVSPSLGQIVEHHAAAKAKAETVEADDD